MRFIRYSQLQRYQVLQIYDIKKEKNEEFLSLMITKLFLLLKKNKNKKKISLIIIYYYFYIFIKVIYFFSGSVILIQHVYSFSRER